MPGYAIYDGAKCGVASLDTAKPSSMTRPLAGIEAAIAVSADPDGAKLRAPVLRGYANVAQ
ncbi:hypothetical protein GGTG_01516 [Gaeumannomyces tritici R3-111a-1]|uniref:Uncharacterized protein n=1 Tax=Gaeumannomyces tritici (strain R3-111a-1) TaxID=644352 RepID=J3NJT5_GAET3|nr:hypothetical protein GGTG_01516 [Gaeumannomyces tritici R3-111a-1]EJT81538.1 hypothetical protein GGTG_01516 [Gaeumannomyces tritici R3-111a-1]